MINILIVDDNIKRYTKLNNAIKELEYSEYLFVKICTTADEARLVLKNISFDIMVLDVVLPKKESNTPSSGVGLKLLDDISNNKRYISPSKIIGITAYIETIRDYKDSFENYTSVVLEAAYNSSSWINQIISNIKNSVQSEIKKNTIHRDSILITLHGIRTHGDWQEDIKSVIEDHSSSFDFYSIKYGFFTFFTFIMPFLWGKVLKNTTIQLDRIIDNNKDKNIHIISHSFGTYVITKYISKREFNNKIKTLILSGSVLSTNFLNTVNIENKVEKLINDCGTKDYILLINKLFTWGLSDAGRIGFISAHSSHMSNRFFIGGHSHYFNKTFYKKYWLPLLLTNNEVQSIDERKYKWYTDITEFIYSFLNKFKYILYIGGISILMMKYMKF